MQYYLTMSMLYSANERIQGSIITDPSILQRGDFLRFLGACEVEIAILDQHAPREELIAEVGEHALLGAGIDPARLLPGHLHILMRVAGNPDEVYEAGMYTGSEHSDSPIFAHVRPRYDDDQYGARLEELIKAMSAGMVGLVYEHDHEEISQTPQGSRFVDDSGDLIR